MKPIIFTDIDGTLIDFETYSYAEVETAVSRLVACQIPIVLCSSKTRAEQAYYRQALHIPDPFIVENGSAIVLPAGYFDADLPPVIELGVTAVIIRQALHHIRRQTGLDFQGYHDLALPEICRITGLDEAAAVRARQREYSETIVTPLTAADYQHLHAALAAYGLTLVSGGKFHTVMSAKSDKGTAVAHLAALFRQQWGRIVTIGLGDSANDAPLLAAVERPFLVQKPGGRWQDMGDLPLTKVAAVGPLGWRQVAEAMKMAHLGDLQNRPTFMEETMSAMIPESHFDLLDGPVVAVLATLMPDGSPQATPVWCSRAGNQVWVNSAKGRQKDRNLRERPFAAITVLDPQNPYRWLEIRGAVVEIVEGPLAHDHINELAQLYFGRPFRTNTPDEARVLYKIAPTRVNASG